MRDWDLKSHPFHAWIIDFIDTGIRPMAPVYRGAFEAGDIPPSRIRVNSRTEAGGGASARFRALSLPSGRRPFGVSIEIPPESWTPAGSRRGWHFFRSNGILTGLWSSLPATWLAQDSVGKPLPPPWRELWTCRITGLAGGGTAAEIEAFISDCVADQPVSPGRRGGTVLTNDRLLSGGRK